MKVAYVLYPDFTFYQATARGSSRTRCTPTRFSPGCGALGVQSLIVA